MTVPEPSACPACGGPNRCAAVRGEAAACWCMQAPAGLPLPPQADTACYCAACLEQRTAPPRETRLER